MLNEVILEKYKIQPVGDDMIDLYMSSGKCSGFYRLL